MRRLGFLLLMLLQLCLIRASEVDEKNLVDSYTGDYTTWYTAPPLECEDWLGGQCLSFDGLVNKSCDFITDELYGNWLCRDYEQLCCVDCNDRNTNSKCHIHYGEDTTARRTCCPTEVPIDVLASGCKCCVKCTPSPWCKKHGGFCVPRSDFNFCNIELGGRVYTNRRRGCRPKNCGGCCIPPA